MGAIGYVVMGAWCAATFIHLSNVYKCKRDVDYPKHNNVYSVHIQDGGVYLNKSYRMHYIREAKLGEIVIADMRKCVIYASHVTSDRWDSLP